MADMGEFNEDVQRAKVVAGFKGGPMFNSPVLCPLRTFVQGWPEEVRQKLEMIETPSMNVIDAWGSRKAK